MKNRKLFVMLMAAVLVMSLLAGCGAKSSDAVANEAAPMEMGDFEYESADSLSVNSGTTTAGTANVEQKLIKRVNINTETEDLDTLLAELNRKISELGGYIEYQELYNGSTYSSYRSRSANLTIRIPADKLASFTEQVEGVSNVVSYNESQDDVTLTYVDTESRVNALKAEEERLLELLAKAETMSDLLEIEERLTEVRYELESTASQLRVLENQVSYATVSMYIEQVKVYTEVEEKTVWQRIGSGFTGNLRDIGEGLVDFFVWAVTYSPQLLILAAVVVLAVILLRRRVNRKQKGSRTQEDGENKE